MRSPEREPVSLPAPETETEIAVVVAEQQAKTRISQALEKLEELLEFVLKRPNIHSGIRSLTMQVKELVAEAEVEESERLTAAVSRAVKAESRAEVAELALRKRGERSQTAAATGTAGPSTSTPPGANQPGGGKRRRGTPEELAERAKKKKADRRPAASQDQGQDQGQGQSQGQDQGREQGQEAQNDGNEEWREVRKRKSSRCFFMLCFPIVGL